MLRKITCNGTRKLIAIKEKSLFIPIRLHSVTISGYILEVHSTSSSLKKKKDGRSLCGRKRRRENETWKKEKEKERMRCGRKKERKEKEKK